MAFWLISSDIKGSLKECVLFEHNEHADSIEEKADCHFYGNILFLIVMTVMVSVLVKTKMSLTSSILSCSLNKRLGVVLVLVSLE